MNKKDPKSYFDMSDKEKKSIIDKATRGAMKAQRELLYCAKDRRSLRENTLTNLSIG